MIGPVDHIGIVVPNLSEAVSQYQRLIGYKLIEREDIPSQLVEVAFMACGLHSPEASTVELLSPLPGNQSLQKFLSSRGPGLHHICYRTDNILNELKRLENEGCVLIDKVPRQGACGSLIAFVHPKSMGGVLVELCQLK